MIRLAIRVAPDGAEIALAGLLDLAPSGLEETLLPDGRIEYAVYGAPGELPLLLALRAAVGATLVDVVTTEVADDWAERWREFHSAVDIGGRLRVRPPWAPQPSAAEQLIDVVIEPAQAFGTGAHPTTRLCLDLLLQLPATGSVVDIGCGSGVLAISAAKLGFAPVIALDSDRASLEACRANAAANGIRLETRHADLRCEALPRADVILANLLAPLLIDLAPRLERPPRHMIASGLLAEQADGVAQAFAELHHLIERRRAGQGDWVALLLERESQSKPRARDSR